MEVEEGRRKGGGGREGRGRCLLPRSRPTEPPHGSHRFLGASTHISPYGCNMGAGIQPLSGAMRWKGLKCDHDSVCLLHTPQLGAGAALWMIKSLVSIRSLTVVPLPPHVCRASRSATWASCCPQHLHQSSHHRLQHSDDESDVDLSHVCERRCFGGRRLGPEQEGRALTSSARGGGGAAGGRQQQDEKEEGAEDGCKRFRSRRIVVLLIIFGGGGGWGAAAVVSSGRGSDVGVPAARTRTGETTPPEDHRQAMMRERHAMGRQARGRL